MPEIPPKRYFTIGEASQLCEVKPHVLRYWEQEFAQLAPMKRRGNRRYYRREDIVTIRSIRHLLYDRGFTISGARQQLESVGADAVPERPVLSEMINELEQVLEMLRSPLLPDAAYSDDLLLSSTDIGAGRAAESGR